MTKHHLIACPIFAKELAAVLGEGNQQPAIQFMDERVHFRPEVMRQEVDKGIATAMAKGASCALLVGRECECSKPITEITEGLNARLPEGMNCIEIILGKERAKELQENRTTVMTPAWMEMIANSIKNRHWTVEDARINLGHYDRIIILDFGLEPLSDETILEFFELAQVPIEILPADLDYFRQVVAGLLAPSAI